MSAMREIARFRSPRFVPILPESSQLAPGAYGAELAFWLAGTLARRGIATGYPVAGERCWLLRYVADTGAAFEVACANVEGDATHWRITLACHGEGAAGASFEAAQPLVNAIRFVLYRAVPGKDIGWRYEE